MTASATDARERAAIALLCAALGAYAPALARAVSSVMPDASAQRTVTLLAFAPALGVLLFALRPHAAPALPARIRRGAVAGSALGLPVATWAWLALLPTARSAPAAAALVLTPPLAAAGYAVIAVSAALAVAGERAARSAWTWLTSASLCAAVAQRMLPELGAERSIAAACALGAAAALVIAHGVALRAAALLAFAAALTASALGPRLLRVPEQLAAPSGVRALRAEAAAQGLRLQARFDGWDASGRVQAFELIARDGKPAGGGALLRDSALVAPTLHGLHAATARGNAIAQSCESTLFAEPFRGAGVARVERVLLAGVGGGLELECALAHGASRIDVAEPSRAQLAAVRSLFGTQPGLRARGVQFHVENARALARRRPAGTYDLVLLSSARGKHTLPPGVLPVPEQVLETEQGLRELLSALAPKGALWALLPDEPAALRFAITAEQALASLAARTPNAHVVVYRAGDAHAVGVHRSPLDISRVLELHRRAKQPRAIPEPRHGVLEQLLGWEGARTELVYTPGAVFKNAFGALFASAGHGVPDARRARYAFDLGAPTDDRPLFAELARRDRPDTWARASAFRALPELAATALAVALGLALLCAARSRPRLSARAAGALACLGAAHVLGYAFVQHLLALTTSRPEHAFALAALALPAFALLRSPFRPVRAALPHAACVYSLAIAATVPLAPLLVLFVGHAAAGAGCLGLLVAALVLGWSPRGGATAATAALACLLGAVTGCAGEPQPAPQKPIAPPAGDTLAILPDTQFYACAFPHIFERQAAWIADNHAEQGIALVLHTGDIVDRDIDAQWRVAEDSMRLLRGEVPYLVTSGNHDLEPDRASLIGRYFDPSELERYVWEAESLDPDRPDNSYAIVDLAGRSWLFIGLEFGPRDAAVRWAGEVLDAHADLPAVVFTHAYLYGDGTRYDRARQPPQAFHPDAYLLTPEQGISDGEDLWRVLIEPNENVRLVVSGHVIPDGVARASSRRASGSVVHELLANFQTCEFCPCTEVEGGGGYLRLLSFDAQATSIRVATYSPHLDRFLTDPENQFTLDL